jgi:RsiW-degrading membrane proteinase PrsW (M82 family)
VAAPVPDAPPPGPDTPGPSVDPKTATLLQVAGAVFWSFFGVRKGRHMQQDAVTIKPLHVVIVGLLSGLVFVLALIALVSYITRNAP